jgi:hypothetical protein
MKNGIARISLLLAAACLATADLRAQDGAANSAIIEFDTFSGLPNPVVYVDLSSGSKLAEKIRSLARDAKMEALTPETGRAKLNRATYGRRGIVISDPSGDLMDGDASIVINPDTITTVKDGKRAVYANTHSELYKLLVKHAYQAGALDRRAALHLYGK